MAGGDISERYTGTTQRPRPEPAPIKSLGDAGISDRDVRAAWTDLPMTKGGTEAETAMRVEPIRMKIAFMRIDVLRPKDSMELSAAMLPRSPPTDEGCEGDKVKEEKHKI